MKRYFIFLILVLLTSCSSDDTIEEHKKENTFPSLVSLSFYVSDNPYQLVQDVHGEIIGDSVVNFWIPYLLPNKKLIPVIEKEGDKILINDDIYAEPLRSVDFSCPAKLTVQNLSDKKDYMVYVHTFTGLPVMWIETEDRRTIDSKEVYQKASFRLEENVTTRGAGDIIVDSVQIKGRGNSSWESKCPKKSYRLKFNRKVSLCDEHEDKSWVLIANYFDKTMLRNRIAYFMGSISNLNYTPKCHFVELMLNGVYNGTYLLCEKIKVAKHRVDVGDDGYLLEVDTYAYLDLDSRTFVTPHLPRNVNIKEPDVEYGDEKFNYIKDYVLKAEEILFSDSFLDNNNGWKKYFDMDSFVDWYLINEIAKNHDSHLITSCYMNLKPGGKLKMGPMWDFDIAFGNIDYDETWQVEGYRTKNAEWFSRMHQDPEFVSKLKECFDFFYNRKDIILDEINVNAEYLKYAVQEIDNKWHTFYAYTFPNYDIWGGIIMRFKTLNSGLLKD